MRARAQMMPRGWRGSWPLRRRVRCGGRGEQAPHLEKLLVDLLQEGPQLAQQHGHHHHLSEGGAAGAARQARRGEVRPRDARVNAPGAARAAGTRGAGRASQGGVGVAVGVGRCADSGRTLRNGARCGGGTRSGATARRARLLTSIMSSVLFPEDILVSMSMLKN